MSSLSFHADSTARFLPVSVSMKKTVLLRQVANSERLALVRPASLLDVRARPEMLSTGILELDALTGGIPRGCLSAICGPPSSGKTSVLVATMAAATGREETCALLDSSDSFDPASAALAGLDCNKLLWVRCGGGSPLCFQGKGQPAGTLPRSQPSSESELRLAQVIKTNDLLLESGGFGLVVLDLAGIPEKYVRRIPLASWFRLQRVVEHTKTALLVVSEIVCAQTCATLVIQLAARASRTAPSRLFPARGGGVAPASRREPPHAQLLEGMQVEATIVRSRLERKPAQSVRTDFRTQAIRHG
jgi:recombination protein RecA